MHERVSVNALCFNYPPLVQMEEIWRDLDPRSVSFVANQIMADGEHAAKAIIARNRYRVETISHAFTLKPLEPNEASWAGPRADLSRMISFANSVDARSVYLVTGGRGSRNWQEAAEIFAAAIAPCRDEAKIAGVALLVETAPALYAGFHLVHTLRDTIRLAEMAGIGVCIDIFSVWTEADLEESIERALPICALVQASDFVYGDRCLPARAVPGDGNIPLRRICKQLIDGGYRNGFDLELIGPRIDQEGHKTAAARAARYVSDLLSELGA